MNLDIISINPCICYSYLSIHIVLVMWKTHHTRLGPMSQWHIHGKALKDGWLVSASGLAKLWALLVRKVISKPIKKAMKAKFPLQFMHLDIYDLTNVVTKNIISMFHHLFHFIAYVYLALYESKLIHCSKKHGNSIQNQLYPRGLDFTNQSVSNICW